MYLADKNILVYSQDLGGANFLLPTIKSIINKYPAEILVHPISEPIFKKRKIYYNPIRMYYDSLPLPVDSLKDLLVKKKITHVYCTTSSPYKDLTNANLILASKELGISCYGVMDHWKGYDRFFDKNGKSSYLPDYIGCIDDYCRDEFLKYYDKTDNIFVIGHPHLEQILRNRKPVLLKEYGIKILLISQPVIRDQSFRSIFSKKIGLLKLIDYIYEKVIDAVNKKVFEINYRPHPKEEKFVGLPKNIGVDRKNWDESILSHDIFIGVDSMALFEAHIAGKYCITINMPELDPESRNINQPQFGSELNSLDRFGLMIKEGKESIKSGFVPDLDYWDQKFTGSLKRSISFFEHFLNEN